MKKFVRNIFCDQKYQPYCGLTHSSIDDESEISGGSERSDQENNNNQHELTIEWSDDETGEQIMVGIYHTSTAKKNYADLIASNKRDKRRRFNKSLENIRVRRKLDDADYTNTCANILKAKSQNTLLSKENSSPIKTCEVEAEIECPTSDEEELSMLNETECSQMIETPSTAISQAIQPPHELDLLLALIEKENSTLETSKKRKMKRLRCVPGGYLQSFQKTIRNAKADRRFLEHDKKIGLQNGVVFNVQELKESFGVRMATLQLANANENLQIYAIIPEELMVTVGRQVEAFFDDTIEPYKLGSVPVFVQPNKLVLL